jgi:ABC-type bacteriocin/lantibiotic exporter with double-glycine peptidase domain
LITATLKDLKGSTTVVVVAHRAETLAACDRIIDLSAVAIGSVSPQPVM